MASRLYNISNTLKQWLFGSLALLGGTNSVLANVETGLQVDVVKVIEQAISQRKQGKTYDSIEILQQLKLNQQNNIRVYLELAISYLKVQQHDKASAEVASILSLAPSMKDNKRLLKLQEMIATAQQKAKDSKHQFKYEVTAYRGFDELTAKYPYFEITEFEDFYQVERKEESFATKHHYIGTRLKAQYRYTPTKSFNLFGQPTYSFLNSRITHFEKHSLGDHNAYFGFDSFDSSYFLLQPKRWAFNAKIKGKWHSYHGERSLTEKYIDINGSVLFYGARFKLGVNRTSNALDSEYAEKLFGDGNYIFERKTSIVSPYVKLSYRFSPSLLWTVGSRRRSIHATIAELEGKVINYSSTLKYNVSDKIDLHTSFYYDELSYDVVDLELGLHSGELKRSLIVGLGYRLDDNWRVGINALHMDRKQNDDYGQDQQKRMEAFVQYSF